MKKKNRWLAAMLAAVLTMGQVVATGPMTAAAVETTTIEATVPPEEIEAPETAAPGWYLLGDDWYYYDLNGDKVFGWKQVGKSWYYFDGNNSEKPGVMLADCKQVISGSTYFFHASGAMQTGWVKREEGWYYTDGSGAMVTGWKLDYGKWYYLDKDNAEYPGLMLKSCKKAINGTTYFFEAGGAMATDWYWDGEAWYYFEDSGLQVSGWKYVAGAWYYLNPANENKMDSDGWKIINNKKYYLHKNGAMATSWLKLGTDWYYLGADGAVKSGWQLVSGIWYYMNPAKDNKMEAGGWIKNNGKWYYLQKSGAMATGWLKLGADWYYLGPDGAMWTGWQKIDYLWYYLYKADDSHGGPEGAMAKNTTIDGWELMGNGVMRDTYIEVNLTTQHMWFVQNGNVVFESDVVTGRPGGRETPAGEFTILEKKRNKILTGNIDPSTGKPEYRTPVDYWMRVTWSGIGFHDATWQPKFGGDWYKSHGSHGCINMPYNAAKTLYNLISVGTRTIIHY